MIQKNNKLPSETIQNINVDKTVKSLSFIDTQLFNDKKDNLSILNAQPNPFKTETSVEFSLQDKTNLTVQLMDVTGKLINEPITNRDFMKGNHKLEINAQQLNLKQGLYFLVIYGDIKCKHVKLVVEWFQ